MSNENQIINTSNERITQLVSVMNQESLDVVKGLVAAQNLTDAEFKQFIVQCKRTGLDPVTRQIYAIKSQGRMAVMTSIDGFRLIAERSGHYAGQDGPYWCGDDGQWVDIWLKPTPPAAAKVGVLRKGFDKPLYAVAVFNEYAKRLAYDNTKTGAKKGDLEFMWAKMPALMIAKVAESLALRKAFPNDMSGIYTADEMEQADNFVPPEKKVTSIKATGSALVAPISTDTPLPAPVAAPAPEDDHHDAWEPPVQSNDPGAYVVPFGKTTKGKTLNELGGEQVASIAQFFTDKLKSGESLGKPAQDFLAAADAYLAIASKE